MTQTLSTKTGSNSVTGQIERELMVGYWFTVDGDNMGDRYFSKDNWTLTETESPTQPISPYIDEARVQQLINQSWEDHAKHLRTES